MPTHFEPLESPVHNALYPRDTNPPVNWFTGPDNRFAPPGDPHFPYVLTTYRLTEHHTAGGMSRFLPHLVRTAASDVHRALARARAAGRPRKWRRCLRRLAARRRRSEGAGQPAACARCKSMGAPCIRSRCRFISARVGPSAATVANDLMAISGEPNVTIMETKALVCNLVPGKLPRGTGLSRLDEKIRARAGSDRDAPPRAAAARRATWWPPHARPRAARKIGMIGEGILSPNQRRHDYVREGVEVGFFTDPTLCIGCKACEVACKEWNEVPEDGFHWSGNSYDNTGHVGALHLAARAFRRTGPAEGPADRRTDVARHARWHAGAAHGGEDPFRWVFLSDVCKHCDTAGCLESCPTGSIVRTEVGSVLVQNDVCNGCGYCVVSCPFGVIDKRPEPLPECRRRVQMHLLLRPPKERPHAGLRESLPDRIDPLRSAHRLARERPRSACRQLHRDGYDDAQIYDPQDNLGRRHSRLLHPARRMRSLRPPAAPGVADYLSEKRVDRRVRDRVRRRRDHPPRLLLFRVDEGVEQIPGRVGVSPAGFGILPKRTSESLPIIEKLRPRDALAAGGTPTLPET